MYRLYQDLQAFLYRYYPDLFNHLYSFRRTSQVLDGRVKLSSKTVSSCIETVRYRKKMLMQLAD